MSNDPGKEKGTTNAGSEKADASIDLEAVATLIAALEQDLAKVSSGSKDIQELRDEVEELRQLLHSRAEEEGVAEKLHTIKGKFEKTRSPLLLEAIREGQYIAIIGRILGLS
ncbi:MAG: hypothetical protein A2W04_01205 [Betaproteobacteria bacterium RBG_16_64_9]|nr:MAG: hypothetical protein A2W04_01205 [Betaproteobacteria bacterium RBG_16_64_9]OGA24133.1 MAG: hypothetical protein A3I01_14760 [Betaproteobacteria bacterium RIFCSPLOWO2_02_FULL_65_24]OGA95273.1 MAG: hypothetical protein A3G27_06185 [Betaproteobacteria bacterium RIFCSPLOWO2_12_FULL_66_14]